VKITPFDAVSRSEFGCDVSIHNELAIIGAKGNILMKYIL
jgi:hypothetical protein